jgi:hypothetical protein
MKRLTLFIALVGVLALPAMSQAQPFWSETFDTDLGDFTAVNDGQAANAWLWDGTCPATGEAGHSIAGTAHWINPTTCLDYGDLGTKGQNGSLDILRSVGVTVPDACVGGVKLELNYYLDFNEDAEFDRARVLVVINGALDEVVLDNGLPNGLRPADRSGEPRPESIPGNTGIGGLEDTASWTPVGRFLAGVGPADIVEIRIVGEVVDGFLNQGEGFLVDDVALSCIQPYYEIPTMSTVGFGAFGALLIAAALVALAQRRRTERT